MSGTVRIDPDLVDRRIRMLTNHIKNPTLRAKRRAKMKEELATLLKIQDLYNREMVARKAEASQKKLEEVVPELKDTAKDAERAHLKAKKNGAVAMLPTVFDVFPTEEETEK
jgi:gas vesicle protein